MVKTDSRLPSGGIKNSGYGRECGHYGFEEFANIKTLWVDKWNYNILFIKFKNSLILK